MTQDVLTGYSKAGKMRIKCAKRALCGSKKEGKLGGRGEREKGEFGSRGGSRQLFPARGLPRQGRAEHVLAARHVTSIAQAAAAAVRRIPVSSRSAKPNS